MAMEESRWAEDYGRALCLPPDRAALPRDQLTPTEQQCVVQVGTAAESRLLARFGAPGPQPPTSPELYRFDLQGPTGQALGQLTYADGALVICWTKDQRSQCDTLGHGHDALVTAMQLLQMQGIQLRETPAVST